MNKLLEYAKHSSKSKDILSVKSLLENIFPEKYMECFFAVSPFCCKINDSDYFIQRKRGTVDLILSNGTESRNFNSFEDFCLQYLLLEEMKSGQNIQNL